jgi:hypothetical protein
MQRVVQMSILALYVAVSCGFAFRLRSQVNARLPRGQSAEFVPIWNYWRMLKLHQKFYPDSPLRLAVYLWEFAGAAAVFLLLAFWGI